MKNKYKGAVFFDYDGTLADEREGIYKPTEKTKESLDALHENGYIVGLATGRAKCYVPKMDINFDCYVTSNGAYAEVDGSIVSNELMSIDELYKLFDFFKENKMGYMTENSVHCYYSPEHYKQFEKMLEMFNIKIDCFSPLPDDISGIQVNKLMFTYEKRETLNLLHERFGSLYDIKKHRHSVSGDLGKIGVSKAVGISRVIKEFNLDISDTYAFGDGDNDYEMLTSVGHGIVMGNHSKKLEEIAEYITDDVLGEGVTNGLIKFGLI